jgi:hypothetical protein
MTPFTVLVSALASVAQPVPAALEVASPAEIRPSADGTSVAVLNNTPRAVNAHLSIQGLPPEHASAAAVAPVQVHIPPAGQAHATVHVTELPHSHDAYLTAADPSQAVVVRRLIRLVPASEEPKPEFALAKADRWELFLATWPWSRSEATVTLPLRSTPSPLPQGKSLDEALKGLRVDLVAKD